MCRHRQVAGPLPASFHHVDFGRPAAVICEHPEGRPYTGPNRYLRTDLEISILLRKPTLGRQDARYVFIVEEHRLQCRRRAGCNDRENSISNFERVEPKRSCCSSAIAWIHVYLLFAVIRGFPFEVGAVSSPVARFRPCGAAGIMRHPLPFQQWMLVEVIVERSVQGHRGKGAAGPRRVDATTSFTGRITRNLQGQPYRRGLEILLRKSWHESDEKTSYGQDFRRQIFLSSIGSMIDRQAFLRRNYTVCSFVLSWALRKQAARLAAFFVASCGFIRTGAGDRHTQRRCPNPDHRNGNAERKTPCWCPRPWRHKRRCCRTVPLPWRLRLPAPAVRHSGHLHWDGRTRTRPAPGSPPGRTPALRSSTGSLPRR